MKLPMFLPIAGSFYSLLRDDSLLKERGMLAYCDYHAKEIVFDLTAHDTEEDLLHTLIHEIKHAHQHEYGLGQALGSDIREVDAETTATVMLNVFDLKFKNQRRPNDTRKKKRKKSGVRTRVRGKTC